jgi:Family of unknown function (DUF6118)
MDETREPKVSEPNTDPAALAFEALREEVALARRAVAGLAAERASIEIPDYTETLAQITRASAAAANRLKTIAELPMLHASVQDWARAIDQASAPTRLADRAALATIHTRLSQAAQDVAASLRSARAAEAQNQWLLWAFAGGVLAGMVLGVIAIGPAVHAIL